MKKILIVDDEDDIRMIYRKKLEKSGYEVRTAKSGKEAIEICNSARPDLVLLDIVMPEMDGYKTCEKLRENSETGSIPVIFLTAKDLEPQGILKRCEELSSCGYITKASNFKGILKKIKDIIG